MPRVEIDLPDDLAKTLGSSSVSISAVCERALNQVAARVAMMRRVVENDFAAAEPEMRRLFTSRGFAVLELARQYAWQEGCAVVRSGHVLDALIEEGTSLALFWLSVMEIDPDQIRRSLLRVAEPERDFHLSGGRIRLDPSAAGVLQGALDEAVSLGHDAVGCQHLLLGLINDEIGVAGPILRELGAEPRLVRDSAPFTREGQIQPPEGSPNPGHTAERDRRATGDGARSPDQLRHLSERVRRLEAILGVSSEE